MKAFINFERKIYEQVKSKDPSQIGKAIANIFPDNWKCKNGILSRNEDDGLSNFDITSYLLAIMGSDPNIFYSKLKEKFGEDKFPFFGQELAIRLAYTGIVNQNIVNGALSGLKDQLDKALEKCYLELNVNANDCPITSMLIVPSTVVSVPSHEAIFSVSLE